MQSGWPRTFAILVIASTPCFAEAQATYFKTTPDAAPAQPPAKPKPKPLTAAKAPPPAAPKAAPAPVVTKAAPSNMATPEPPRPHRVAIRPKPAPREARAPSAPSKPLSYSGPVQVSPSDGSLTVANQPIVLSGLQIKSTDDFASRLKGWVDRNGRTVRCVPQGDAFKCTTPGGADLGGALVVSGFGLPTADAQDVYKNLAQNLQIRSTVLGASPSPALNSLLAGTANPHCQNTFTCGARYIALGYRRHNAAFARQDWKALVDSIVSVNYQNDIDFYYLGRAAEAMGAYSAAAIYYQKAASLTQSQVPLDRCATLGPDVCGGINIAADLNQRMSGVQGLANFMF